MVGARGARGLTTRFRWCKAHVGIDGNERADAYAKAGCEGLSPSQMTEDGVRAYWRDVVAGEKKCVGFGLGSVVRWRRRAAYRYVQARSERGDLGAWREKLGRLGVVCRLCGKVRETGHHLTFECEGASVARGWGWNGWDELDVKGMWGYVAEEEDGVVRGGDKVEDFFLWLDGELCGVG